MESTSGSWLLFRIIRLCARVLARWRAISAGATVRSGPNAIISGDKPAKVK